MRSGKVLITGAGGYLGSRLARKYLEETGMNVLLWAHARNAEEALEKRAVLEERYRAWAGRVEFAFGDLSADHPIAGIDSGSVTEILHGAALIRFNVEQGEALRVNVKGAEKLLDFASRCPNLERLGLLSTVYASGLRSGVIEEKPFGNETGFCNHYEGSKWEAEDMLLRKFSGLPWRLLRIATVIADDADGRVSQYNAVHNTLMLFYYGLLSLIPGNAESPLYFITGEFAADAMFEAMRNNADARIYHICHSREESISLTGFVDTAFAEFGNDETFRTRRLLKPLFADARAFDLLAEGMKSFGGDVVNQSLASVAPFARQLFISKDIRNQNLRSAWPGYSAPDPVVLVRNTCRHLVATRWGRA